MNRVCAVLVLGIVMGATLAWAAEEKPEGKRTEAIDFRKLKELLPEELGGIKRTDAKGERNKVAEFSISHAEGTYAKGEEEKSPRITLQYQDFAGSAGEGLAAAASVWTQMDVDRETDEGYEKTFKIAGHPAFETWNKNDKHSQIQILVAKRFMVTLQTDNLAAGEAKKIAEKLPLDKLAALK